MLPHWFNYRTHAHVMGTSQSGKSKFAEYCMREHTLQGNAYWLLDWHGTLYRDVLNYLAYLRPARPIVLLNPSEPDLIVPFNPFKLDGEVTAHAMRLADVIVKPWGEENTNELPTYERLAQMLLTFMAVTGEPLHHAAKLLELPKRELREYAISAIEDDFMKQQWKQFQYLTLLKGGFRDWKNEVLSTQNRLMRFIGSQSVKLFTGLPGEGLNVDNAIQDGAIVLVNLKPSPSLSPKAGKVFGSLILSELLYAAIKHTGEERPVFIYLDEAQNYMTADSANILDQVLKTGMRLTLIHHHLGQFYGNIPLIESLRTNAQIRVLFKGLPPHAMKEAAEEFFLQELNERWKKDGKVHYITKHYEDVSFTESHTDSVFGEEEGSSDSQSFSSRLVPYVERIVDGQEDFTMEEKLSKLSARFCLPTQECYIKFPDDAFKWRVPYVDEALLSPDTVLQFQKDTQPNAIPLDEAERILKDQERAFLERSREYESRGSRPKKRPPNLHPQR